MVTSVLVFKAVKFIISTRFTNANYSITASDTFTNVNFVKIRNHYISFIGFIGSFCLSELPRLDLFWLEP